MEKFDLNKEYGLVLEGGGAKGAYQIGVWKAAIECGVRFRGVSGVSVGALNGALICMGDLEKAETLWKNITYSQVMLVDDEQMDGLLKRNFKGLNVHEIVRKAVEILGTGGVDVTPLRELIEKNVDEEKVRNSGIEFVLGTFQLSGLKEVEITAQEAGDGYLKDFLLASAYIPLFKTEKLHGRTYLDGGMFNNVPVDMLLNRGYEDIIVIRIHGPGLIKPVRIPKNVTVTEISPRVSLGNFLEFDGAKSERNMKVGYFDGLRCFRNLKGEIYYLNAAQTPEWYIQRFLKVHPSVYEDLFDYFKIEHEDAGLWFRLILEQVLPHLAQELRLSDEWTYEQLYLSILELCAKSLRVAKYRVYDLNEFICEIMKKYTQISRRDEVLILPEFQALMLKMAVMDGEFSVVAE